MSQKSLVDGCKDEGIDTTDAEPRRDHVSTKEPLKAAWYDGLYVGYSIVIYIADVVTDMLVSVKYFRSGDYIWFSLTLFCVLGASLVMMLFSLYWYYKDTAKEVSKTRTVVLHVLQLGPLKRYWDCYKNGKRSRKNDVDRTYYNIYIEQWRDIAMLRLFEVFIESAPQLVLQLYILAYNRHFDKDEDWLTVCSACFSLLSLSTSIVSYSKALRDASDNKGKMTWWAFGSQIVWRLTMVASRIVTLVLFASVYKSWILLVIGVHWVAMTIWIRIQNTSFCPDNRVLRFMYSVVIGFIYVFCFFNVKDGFTRRKLLCYYTLMFVENCALMGAWLPYRHEYGVVFVVALGTVFGGFLIGVLALLLYYQCYHPSLETQGICVRTTHNVPLIEGIVYRMICCNTCCLVRSYEDEEFSIPAGSQLQIDIPASRGSLRRDVSESNVSPTLESELLFHKPSSLQKQVSLEKEKIKREKAERARQRHSIESATRNGVNSVVVQVSEVIPYGNGTVSHPSSPHSDTKVHPQLRNEIAYAVDIHAPKPTQLGNGHVPITDNACVTSQRNNFNSVPQVSDEALQSTVSHTTVNMDPEGEILEVVDLNRNTSCVNGSDRQGNRTPCDDGIHCGTDDEGTRIPCDDGEHCGADDEKGAGITCDDGLHCGTDDEREKGTPCDDGVHCGTDDEHETKSSTKKSRTPCDDDVHCGTHDEKNTKTSTKNSRTPCDDGVHCGTDDEEDTKNRTKKSRTPCDDGVHCGTDDEEDTKNRTKKSRTPCDDGVHCGTDDEEDTKTSTKNSRTPCDDGVHCGTDDEEDTKNRTKKSRIPCDDGVLCGTDDEDDTKTAKPTNNNTDTSSSKTPNTEVHRGNDNVGDACALADSHVHITRPPHPDIAVTPSPKYSNTVNFHHRYSIVSDCISLSSSTSSENEEDRFKEDENLKDNPSAYESSDSSFIDQTLDNNSNLTQQLLSQDEYPTPSNSLQYASFTRSLPRTFVTKRNPKQRAINRRSRLSNRISFPNFVATSLKRGRFSSLRRSREDCTKKGEDARRHTVDFSVLSSGGPFDDETFARLTKSLKPKKFGSVRDELEKLSLT